MKQQHGGLLARAAALALVLTLVLALAPVPAQAADTDGARQAILQCYETGAESVDLEPYGLTADALQALFNSLQNGNALPWYASGYHYRYYGDTGIVTTFTPNNLDETVYDRNLYEQKAAQILAATVFPGMADWQIALSIHDYLAANFAYDETYTYTEGYDLLVRGTAVCSGYAKAYMDLMKRAGIECVFVKSGQMDHSWNLIRIGGNWYHVDVTWDDPTPNLQGLVLHDFFLISDSVISDADHKHDGWETDIACTDTTFDSGLFWADLKSQICYLDSSTSFYRQTVDVNQTTIYRRNEQTGGVTALCTQDEGYLDIGAGKYYYGTCGLTLWNGLLYWSDMQRVYSMEPDGSGLQTVYPYDTAANGRCISGSFVEDGVIRLTLRDHSGNLLDQEIPLTGVTWHRHSYTAGETTATCTESGYTVYTCACGVCYPGDFTQALGHDYDEGQITREATAVESGLRTFTCRRCGYQYTEEIPATGLAILQPAATTAPASSPEPSFTVITQKESSYFPFYLLAVAIVVVAGALLNKKKE